MIARLPTFVFVLFCVVAAAVGSFIGLLVAAIIINASNVKGSVGEDILFLSLGLLGLILPIILLSRRRKHAPQVAVTPPPAVVAEIAVAAAPAKDQNQSVPSVPQQVSSSSEFKFPILHSKRNIWVIASIAVALFIFYNWKHVPINPMVNPHNLGLVDRIFFYTGQAICDGMVTIGWKSFYINVCLTGTVYFPLPNYIAVGQAAGIITAVLVFFRGVFVIWL